MSKIVLITRPTQTHYLCIPQVADLALGVGLISTHAGTVFGPFRDVFLRLARVFEYVLLGDLASFRVLEPLEQGLFCFGCRQLRLVCVLRDKWGLAFGFGELVKHIVFDVGQTGYVWFG